MLERRLRICTSCTLNELFLRYYYFEKFTMILLYLQTRDVYMHMKVATLQKNTGYV